jgi:DNA-binding MarR family transcriptional regulator
MEFSKFGESKEFKNKSAKISIPKIFIPHGWWRSRLLGLTPMERCILISLGIWKNMKPSKSQLARELKTTTPTIRRNLKNLKKKGFDVYSRVAYHKPSADEL